MSPALEGGSLTIGPPVKPLFCVFILVVIAVQNCTLFDLYSDKFIKRKADIPQNYHRSQGTYDLLTCVCTSSGKGFSSLSHKKNPSLSPSHSKRSPSPIAWRSLDTMSPRPPLFHSTPLLLPLPPSFLVGLAPEICQVWGKSTNLNQYYYG